MGGEINNGIDNSIEVLNRAVGLYSSPESALRAMYTGGEAEKLGAQMVEQVNGRVDTGAMFGPGTIPSARVMNRDLAEVSMNDLESTATRFDSKLESFRVELPNSESIDPEFNTSLENRFAERSKNIKDNIAAETSNLNFQRGLLLVSQKIYNDRNEENNFAIRNAFAGALGYQTPGEIQDAIRDRAATNPEIRENIEQLGMLTQEELRDMDLESFAKGMK